MRRVAPAVGLFFLAPLVAEFLLGNLSVALLPALLVLAPMYGGGALLIREAARRTRRGWPSILLLGLAYGVVEEALVTQSLFNPDYLRIGLRLLAPAYVPALGIGAWWTLFVLTLHAAWSIATPIALVEALVPERATTPWLGRPGLALTALLFVLGSAAVARHTLGSDPFTASRAQLGGATLICGVLLVVASCLPRAVASEAGGYVPEPWLVGAGALVLGSGFLLVPKDWGWWAFAIDLVLVAVAIGPTIRWSRRAGWDARHRFALASGATLTYAWHAFLQPSIGGSSATADLIGKAVLVLGALALLVVAGRRAAWGLGQRSARS